METKKTKSTGSKGCGCRKKSPSVNKKDEMSKKEVKEDVKIINPDESSLGSRG